MDKNAIKKYAIRARRELIEKVAQKAQQYGITEENTVEADVDSIGGVLLSRTEKKQRRALIKKINEDGYEQVIEEVAYTWFNRFTALRFMEVNGYLPSHTRVFTNEENEFKPQILTDAISLDLEGIDIEKVYELKEANRNEELYKYLLIVQCNALSEVLPKMFQKISDYTELLLPDYLLREGSVICQMIEMIPEEDWKDTVQIIGWLYQYYNSEKKDEVFANLKKNVKITKENIPAATQLFTPDWIVRYMVENSLGRLWIEGHPNDDLKDIWKYYLDEAEQEPDVQEQLDEIRKEYRALKPEDILCVDPCAGSGHILVYMFDVLMQIYEAYGMDTRTAVASIVENNIYGLDIDERATQLAYFAVMMKACQYDRRFLRRGIQPNVYAIVESNHVDSHVLEYFCNGDENLKKAMDTIIEEMYDAKEYGSIITVSPEDWQALFARFDEIENEDMTVFTEDALNLKELVQVAEILAQKYHVVVTNPPYMGASGMSGKLNEYVKKNYADSKSDLFAVFIERCGKMTAQNGYQAMITQQAWMFLSSFEKLRGKLLQKDTVNMAHLGPRAFEEIGGEVVQTTSFVLRDSHNVDYKGTYCRLIEPTTQQGKEEMFLSGENHYTAQQSNFTKIPGMPVAYWVSEKLLEDFTDGQILKIDGDTRQGMATSDNNRFLRLWYEVQFSKIGIGCATAQDAVATGGKWFPYNKGGEFRKWYGNIDYVVNYENDGIEVKDYATSLYRTPTRTIKSISEYFKPCLSWSKISSGNIAFRYYPKGFIFDVAGCCIFYKDEGKMFYDFGFINSHVAKSILSIISPTLNYEAGHIASLPVIRSDEYKNLVSVLARSNIKLGKEDWDSYETSWDFARHPLVREASTLPAAYTEWEDECVTRFANLKSNEEELNRIFIDIYGLQDELTPEVEDKDVTVRLADKSRDVRSFISYAVGCMFGRYSLDEAGLIFAGGEWDATKYKTFPADPDNIIPISDDEYFDDDIVARFVKFVEIVYGEDGLQDNLKFIADALGGKGQPKEVIRNYFLNDFYKDHCKIYQKRPIYWLFDSGKKNGFKCLIYMHRYAPDTIARIRTDYVHEQQARYRTAIADLENRIANATTSERVKLNKELKIRNDQAAELHEYEEKIHHLADQMISIDLDDGVKVNYEKFKDVLARIK